MRKLASMSWDADDLADLRFHWQDAYAISGGNGRWVAVRSDDGRALVSDTADGLRVKIREDYEVNPVPRPPFRPRDLTRILRKFGP